MQVVWQVSRAILLTAIALVAIAASLNLRTAKVGPDDLVDAQREPMSIGMKSWHYLDSGDWLHLAKAAAHRNDWEKSFQYLARLLQQNPTHGEALAYLAHALLQRGDNAGAVELAALASQIGHGSARTYEQLAIIWTKLGRQADMLQAWDVLLTRLPGIRPSLFPHLRLKLEDPALESIFKEFTQRPASWWPDFFNYLAWETGFPVTKLERLYNWHQAAHPVSLQGGSAYLERLLQEGHWTKAWELWLDLLPKETKGLQDTLFDGSFEAELQNHGLAWFIQPLPEAKITLSPTFGATGRRALSIHFTNAAKHLQFQHVWQRLLLRPGSYQLAWRVRTSNLRTSKGLVWRIRCLGQQNNVVLLESPPMREASTWQTMQGQFTVPATCPAQLLRLETASHYAHEQTFTGKIWLDNIQISSASR